MVYLVKRITLRLRYLQKRGFALLPSVRRRVELRSRVDAKLFPLNQAAPAQRHPRRRLRPCRYSPQGNIGTNNLSNS